MRVRVAFQRRVAAPFIAAMASCLLLTACTAPFPFGAFGPCTSGKGYPDRVLGQMAYSPDGNFLAVGYSGRCNAEREVWDANNLQQPPTVLSAPGREIDTLAFSRDSKLLAYGCDDGDGIVRIADTSNLAADPIELRGHDDSVWSLAFTPDGKGLVTLDLQGTVRTWVLSNPSNPTKVLQRPGLTNDVAISPDGKTLAISCYMCTEIELWTLPDLNGQVGTLKGVLNPGTAPVFSPDGRYLAIGASTANLQSYTPNLPLEAATELFDMTDPEAPPRLLTGEGGMSVGGVAFSPDGNWLADTRVTSGIVNVWDLTDLDAPSKTMPHDAAYGVAFSPDGKTLATGSMHNSIRLWEYRQPSPAPTTLADPPWSSR